jgi:hypothetical protein
MRSVTGLPVPLASSGPAVVAGARGVSGFELRYLESGDGGPAERQALLTACWNARFEDVSPVRDFPSSKGQRNFPGLYFAACTGRHVGYESWLERSHDAARLLPAVPRTTARDVGMTRRLLVNDLCASRRPLAILAGVAWAQPVRRGQAQTACPADARIR